MTVANNILPGNERKIQIMLVDDERDVLDLLKLTLISEGFEVRTCWNGENLNTLIGENKPDIVLLDIKMKDVDGTEICQMIKNNPATHDIKIILFSANDNLELIEKKCGADGSLAKPYNKKIARQMFQKVLR